MIPKGWDEQQLSYLFQRSGYCKDGDWIESKDQDPAGDVRLVQLADIGDGTFINKSSRYLTSSKAVQLKCTFLQSGDILVARMPEPLGRACIFPDIQQDAVTAVDVCILRPDSDFDTKWLMYALNNPVFRKEIYGKATGTTRTRISRKNLLSIGLLLPPFHEQKRIAEILTSVDDAIQATEKVIEQTKKVKQGLLQELLTRGIGHTKFKMTEIGEIPESWEVGRLGDFADFKNGLNFSQKNYGTGLKVIGVSDFKDNTYPKYSELSQINPEGVLRAGDLLKENDFVFVRSNGNRELIGRSLFIKGLGKQKVSFSGFTIRCRLISDTDLSHPFLRHLFKSNMIRKALSKDGTGTNISNLNQSILANLLFPMSAKPEQLRITDILDSIEEKLDQNIKTLDNQKTLKSGLMQDLLTGRVRVGGTP